MIHYDDYALLSPYPYVNVADDPEENMVLSISSFDLPVWLSAQTFMSPPLRLSVLSFILSLYFCFCLLLLCPFLIILLNVSQGCLFSVVDKYDKI